MAGTTVSFRLSEEMNGSLEKMAKERGESKSEIVKSALELYTSFDPEFLSKAEKSSKQVKVPLHMFIQNKLIKMYAKEAAEIEVWGPGSRLLPEFMTSEKETLTGEELFYILKGMYAQEEKRKLDDLEYQKSAFIKNNEGEGGGEK